MARVGGLPAKCRGIRFQRPAPGWATAVAGIAFTLLLAVGLAVLLLPAPEVLGCVDVLDGGSEDLRSGGATGAADGAEAGAEAAVVS